MRLLPALFLTLAAGPAAAHVGHLGEVAGHGHWLGGAALGAAIAIGLWQGLRGRGGQAQAEEDQGDVPADEDPQEA